MVLKVKGCSSGKAEDTRTATPGPPHPPQILPLDQQGYSSFPFQRHSRKPQGISGAGCILPGTKRSRTPEEDPSFLGGPSTPSSHTPRRAQRQLLFYVSPTPAPVLSEPLPLVGLRLPSLKAPYRPPRPLPSPGPFPVIPCPVFQANLTVPISLPVSHRSRTRHTLATTALLVGGPCRPQEGEAGIRGSTPPGQFGFPSPGLLTCPWRAGSSPPRCGWTASCA